MVLLTGTVAPSGYRETQEDIYIEGGPSIYYQNYSCAERFNPNGDNFYWGLSGTVACPVWEIGCYEDFQMTDDVTSNPVTCQSLGEVDEINKRNSMSISFTLKSLFPLEQLAKIMRGSTYTYNATDGTEAFGLGEITTEFFHFYWARVYDQATGDYFAITGHKGKFAEAGPISTPYGDAWNMPVTVKLFADRTKPSGQRFATAIRFDPSVVV